MISILKNMVCNNNSVGMTRIHTIKAKIENINLTMSFSCFLCLVFQLKQPSTNSIIQKFLIVSLHPFKILLQ